MLNSLSCNGYLYRRYAIESIVTITNNFERESVLRLVEMIVAKDCRLSSYERSPTVGNFFIPGKLSGYTFDPIISGKSFKSNEITSSLDILTFILQTGRRQKALSALFTRFFDTQILPLRNSLSKGRKPVRDTATCGLVT